MIEVLLNELPSARGSAVPVFVAISKQRSDWASITLLATFDSHRPKDQVPLAAGLTGRRGSLQHESESKLEQTALDTIVRYFNHHAHMSANCGSQCMAVLWNAF